MRKLCRSIGAASTAFHLKSSCSVFPSSPPKNWDVHAYPNENGNRKTKRTPTQILSTVFEKPCKNRCWFAPHSLSLLTYPTPIPSHSTTDITGCLIGIPVNQKTWMISSTPSVVTRFPTQVNTLLASHTLLLKTKLGFVTNRLLGEPRNAPRSFWEKFPRNLLGLCLAYCQTVDQSFDGSDRASNAVSLSWR